MQRVGTRNNSAGVVRGDKLSMSVATIFERSVQMNRFVAESRGPVCSQCGGVVKVGQPPWMPGMAPVCEQPRCLSQAVDRLRAQQSASRLRSLRAQLRGGGDVVYTPANRQPTAPLAAARRRRFTQHLEAMLESARSGKPACETHSSPVTAMSGENVHLPSDLPAIARQAIATACANCRGWCCRTGGTTAWITPDTIRGVMLANPQSQVADIRERYLAQVPPRTYTDSCVYHTATGCALEPSLRSETCHTFLCDGANALLQLVRARGDHGRGSDSAASAHVRVAATEGSQVVRNRRVVTR